MSIIHQFLRWLPAAVFTVVMAAAAAFEPAKNWLGATAASLWAHMSEPLYALAVLGVFAVYLAALILTAEKKEVPKLRGEIDQIFANSNVAANSRGPQAIPLELTQDRLWMWLNVSIRNTGSPSIADSWTVYYAVRGLAPVECRNAALQDVVNLAGTDEIALEIQRGRDSIPDKCLTPIPTGGLVRGWLHALTPPHVAGNGANNGDKVIVVFKDAIGKRYTAEFTFQANNKRTDEPGLMPDGTGGFIKSIKALRGTNG